IRVSHVTGVQTCALPILRVLPKSSSRYKKGEENFLAVSFIIYAIISLTIILFGSIGYLYLDELFGKALTLEQLNKAKIMVVILRSEERRVGKEGRAGRAG